MEGSEWGVREGWMGGMWQVLGANGAVWPETQYETSLTLHLSCCHKAEHHFAPPKNKSDLFKEWGIERIIKKVLKTLQPLCSSNKPHNFFNHNEMDKIINMHMAKWKYVNNRILKKYQNIKFLFKQVLRKSVLKRIFWGKNSYYSILLSAFIANINSNGLGYFKKRIAKLRLFGTKSERKGRLVASNCFHASKILLYKYFFAWTQNRFRLFSLPILPNFLWNVGLSLSLL